MKTLLRSRLSAVSRRVPRFPGKARITHVLNRLFAPASHRLVVESFGARFLVRGEDLIEEAILWHGSYGPLVTNCLQAEIDSENVTCFWDIGANIGSVSIPIAHRNPSVRVFAFEPSPSALSTLERNLKMNEMLGNVSVYAYALSNTNGPVPFFESSEGRNSGVGGLYAETHNRDHSRAYVHACTGDSLIESSELPGPDLIKIDTEGWEPEVLDGLSRYLQSSNRLSILWEHCLYRLDERRTPRDAISSRLSALGFELYACRENGRFERFRAEMLNEGNDFLARRRAD